MNTQNTTAGKTAKVVQVAHSISFGRHYIDVRLETGEVYAVTHPNTLGRMIDTGMFAEHELTEEARKQAIKARKDM